VDAASWRGPDATDGNGRRIPFASIPHHTLILLAGASAPYSLPRPRNGNFAHASRSDGPRNLLELQALHPAQPSALVLYFSDFTLTLLHTGRSLDHTHSHTLSLDSCCRPTAGKPSSPAGLFPLVYAYVVDCAPASPYAYSSSTHRVPDERTPIEATPLFSDICGAWFGFGSGFGIGFTDTLLLDRTRSPSSLHPPFTHYYPFPPRSIACGGQTSPHKPRLVVSHTTCSPRSSSPHAHTFVLGTAVINRTNATGLPPQQNRSDNAFRFKRDAFYMGLKSKVGLVTTKASALRINLNVEGCGIVAAPVHDPSHAPFLLPLLLSHNIPLPRVH
jgi:hypothetical protein